MSRGLFFRFYLKAVVCLFVAFPGTVDALEAGAAKVELAVEPGTPLDGYAWRMGRGAVETHDPLWVRALYLEKGDTRLFLVSADLHSISAALRESVLDLVPGDVPDHQVILTATHTHSGPGGLNASWLDRKRSGRFMPEFLEETARHFSEAMRAAYDGRKRAVIGYAVSEELSLTRNAFAEDGERDTQLGVVRVEDSDGTPIAIIANFAATPSTVSDRHAFALSADFPGRFCDSLEDMSVSGMVAFFLNGASGDQVCANPKKMRDWDLAASIGESFAERVKIVSNTIECRDFPLHMGYSLRKLPLSIADSFYPSEAVFQTLEINDLLMAFVPGVVFSEIGLELRKRARARGYGAQFTVGPANGALVTFIPASSFGAATGENAQTLFGPFAAEWLYEGISELMSRGEHVPPRLSLVSPEGVESFGGGARVMLTGSPYQRGYQRGLALGEAIRQAYEQRVLTPIRDGSIATDLGLWNLARRVVDPAPLALAELANEARPLMRGLAASDMEELQGLADGAGLPFLAIWLLHAAPYLANDLTELAGPQGALFAVTEERAGSDGLLVAHVLGGSQTASPLVIDVHPEKGRAYVAVGHPWDVGVSSGMNDAGLVVCVEPAPDLGRPSLNSPPVGFVVRSVLASEVRLEDALEALMAAEGICGYRILVAGPSLSDAAVIEFGDRPVVRRSVDGLLLAREERRPAIDRSHGLINHVSRLYRRAETIGLADLQTVLRDWRTRGGALREASIVSAGPSIVFETGARRMHLSFPQGEGVAGPFEAVTLKRDTR
ncbi:MAG: C45 family autoproteolytic acyltransferase/hydrolase [Candidatus Hydrogenedentes bacterium]|nr:C45 family autoproteolytic acyltransferase/hydrolase [Candidatus Hydrogenedentota bacterium]